MKRFKWGILGPGRMASKFTQALQTLENVELYAVGSRDTERSKAFASEFGFKKAFGSYEEMLLILNLKSFTSLLPILFIKNIPCFVLEMGKMLFVKRFLPWIFPR